jgi:hypothetical protein
MVVNSVSLTTYTGNIVTPSNSSRIPKSWLNAGLLSDRAPNLNLKPSSSAVFAKSGSGSSTKGFKNNTPGVTRSFIPKDVLLKGCKAL